MNKVAKTFAMILLVVILAFGSAMISACGNSGQGASSHICLDVYGEGFCNTCGNELAPEDNPVTPTKKPEKPIDKGEDPDQGVDPPVVKPVLRLVIKANPTKKEYFIDEDFVPDGGVLTATYSDLTTGEVPFTAEGVTVSNVDTSTVGAKAVTVTYGGKKVTLYVDVVKVGGIVTFEMNYAGGEDYTVKVAENRAVVRPENPSRAEYEFYNWYTDAGCTVEYRFSSNKIVSKDFTIYAAWKAPGDFEVVYDLNYYGKAVNKYAQIVSPGQAARAIDNPARDEFNFDGWCTDEQLTQKYVAGTAITEDTTLRAKWIRTTSGTKEYIFEAEHTDLTGKIGPGFSGEAIGDGMIVEDITGTGSLNASNDKYISYLYKDGLGLEFYIANDEQVTSATIKISITLDPSLSISTLSLTSQDWQVIVNNDVKNYGSITVIKEPFTDMIVLTGITLEKGANTIVLLTNNDRNPLGGGGTYAGSAPMVDCIKITTSSVLSWDDNYGLPANIE